MMLAYEEKVSGHITFTKKMCVCTLVFFFLSVSQNKVEVFCVFVWKVFVLYNYFPSCFTHFLESNKESLLSIEKTAVTFFSFFFKKDLSIFIVSVLVALQSHYINLITANTTTPTIPCCSLSTEDYDCFLVNVL